jgi:hypothetical protein
MARTFEGAAKNFDIERHYLRGVIGEGYFAPLVSSEDASERKIRIHPSAAPFDLETNTLGTYKSPFSDEWLSAEIVYDEEVSDMNALLETDLGYNKEPIEEERVLVAYGEHILNDNYDADLLT